MRLPQRFLVHKGKVLTKQNSQEITMPVTITDQAHVGMEYDSWQEKLFLSDYRERNINPAVAQIVNTVDYDGMSRMSKRLSRFIGTPGVNPGTGTRTNDSMRTFLAAHARLLENAIPGPYIAILSPMMHAELVQNNAALFNPQNQIANYFRRGMFGAKAFGIDRWYYDQNVYRHKIGPLTGGEIAVDGALATGAKSITMDAFTGSAAGVVNDGDCFSVDGVFEVNPQNYQSTGHLAQFTTVLDGPAAANGSGEATLGFYPTLEFGATNKEALHSKAIPNNAEVYFFADTDATSRSHAGKTAAQALIYNKQSFVLAMGDLFLPRGLHVAERVRNSRLGISIRMLQDFDNVNDELNTRLDLIYGFSRIRDLGIRVQGG